MGDQNYSIEFFISFPTIYHYVVCDDGKVPAKIVLLYGGKSSYVYRLEWASIQEPPKRKKINEPFKLL